LLNSTGRARTWGALGATLATVLAGLVFVGQIAGKWAEGGWIVLISLSVLVLMAHAILISPIGYRDPNQIYRIIREKSRVQGPMGSIVEWQSLRTQEYRYSCSSPSPAGCWYACRLLTSSRELMSIWTIQKPMFLDRTEKASPSCAPVVNPKRLSQSRRSRIEGRHPSLKRRG
jgi:hypothetical protein